MAAMEISGALRTVVSPRTVMKKQKDQIVKKVIVKPKKIDEEEAIRKIEKKIEQCRLRKADLLEKKKEMVRGLRKAAKKPELVINKEDVKKPEINKVAINKAEADAVVIPEKNKADAVAINKGVKADLNKEFPQIIDLGFQCGFYDKYEPLKLIGRGGFGLVFKAMDRNDGRLVAVKVFRRSKITQAGATFLKREVAVLELLNGLPNAVRFDGAYQSDEAVFLVMELLEGGDMNQKLNSIRGGVCAESEAKKWVKSI